MSENMHEILLTLLLDIAFRRGRDVFPGSGGKKGRCVFTELRKKEVNVLVKVFR